MTNGTENNNAVDPNYVAPDPAPMKNLTLGEIRVKVTFNVAKDEQSIYVNRIKRQSAELIDLINDAVASPHFTDAEFYEWQRLKDLAVTAVEEGAMWGVKAATI